MLSMNWPNLAEICYNFIADRTMFTLRQTLFKILPNFGLKVFCIHRMTNYAEIWTNFSRILAETGDPETRRGYASGKAENLRRPNKIWSGFRSEFAERVEMFLHIQEGPVLWS